jgi:hypothetical protein
MLVLRKPYAFRAMQKENNKGSHETSRCSIIDFCHFLGSQTCVAMIVLIVLLSIGRKNGG